MNAIIVNWVKEDEELLEPYEWIEQDDLELLTSLTTYRVSEKVLYDFIYGCITLKQEEYFGEVFAVSDSNYCVVVEIDDKGKLSFRSLVTYQDRRTINDSVKDESEANFIYTMYDEGLAKEYGLTRKERLKKQYLENKIDELYVEDYEQFLELCEQLEIHGDKSITMYITLKKKIEKGYTFLHELLYNELIKNK